jgi:hypothetical protein
MRLSSTGRTISHLNRRRLMGSPNRLAQANRRRRWVLQLWEAFLLQMDDFDRLLEFQLRRKLDPLVAAPVPVRRGRAGSGRPSRLRREKEASKSMGGMTDLGGALVLPS